MIDMPETYLQIMKLLDREARIKGHKEKAEAVRKLVKQYYDKTT